MSNKSNSGKKEKTKASEVKTSESKVTGKEKTERNSDGFVVVKGRKMDPTTTLAPLVFLLVLFISIPPSFWSVRTGSCRWRR